MFKLLYEGYLQMRNEMLLLKERLFCLYPACAQRTLAAHILESSGVRRENIIFPEVKKGFAFHKDFFYILFEKDKYYFFVENGVCENCIAYSTSILNLVKNWGMLCNEWDYNLFRKKIKEVTTEEQRIIVKNLDKIKLTYDILNEDSKLLFLYIILKRLLQIETYFDVLTPDQYFLDELIKYNGNEVYVDIGAFNGDTIKAFAKACPNYSHIFAFEPDESNFQELVAETSLYSNITYFNCLCSNENTFLNFIGHRGSLSAVSRTYLFDTKERFSVKLDSLRICPSFIKIDTEGSEKEIILGAYDTIFRCSPRLAVCIYHKIEDLWDIPLYFHEHFPQYSLRIRHHSAYKTETVLYVNV